MWQYHPMSLLMLRPCLLPAAPSRGGCTGQAPGSGRLVMGRGRSRRSARGGVLEPAGGAGGAVGGRPVSVRVDGGEGGLLGVGQLQLLSWALHHAGAWECRRRCYASSGRALALLQVAAVLAPRGGTSCHGVGLALHKAEGAGHRRAADPVAGKAWGCAAR